MVLQFSVKKHYLEKWHFSGLFHQLVQLINLLADQGRDRVATGNDSLWLSGNIPQRLADCSKPEKTSVGNGMGRMETDLLGQLR